MADELWAPRELGGGECFNAQVGPLELWVERVHDECRVATRSGQAQTGMAIGMRPKPVELEWRRWVAGPAQTTLVLEPCLPNRAIIARPAMPIRILPGCDVDFFVSIPIWLRVCLAENGEAKRVVLYEEPTVQLSNSWFGTPVEGELCYALKTRARRRLDELRPDAHLAVCSVNIRNAASDELSFDRLCLRLQSLSLYAAGQHLWTNEGSLTYRGDEALTRIVFSQDPPARDGAACLLAGPRVPGDKGVMMRAFDSLKAFAPF